MIIRLQSCQPPKCKNEIMTDFYWQTALAIWAKYYVMTIYLLNSIWFPSVACQLVHLSTQTHAEKSINLVAKLTTSWKLQFFRSLPGKRWKLGKLCWKQEYFQLWELMCLLTVWYSNLMSSFLAVMYCKNMDGISLFASAVESYLLNQYSFKFQLAG